MADTVDSGATVFVRSLNDGQIVIHVQTRGIRLQKYRKCARVDVFAELARLDEEIRLAGVEPGYDIRIAKGIV